MLTEKSMVNWLNIWHGNSLSLYPFKVFSVSNLEDFHNYLDGIENSITNEMREELQIVYDIPYSERLE